MEEDESSIKSRLNKRQALEATKKTLGTKIIFAQYKIFSKISSQKNDTIEKDRGIPLCVQVFPLQ